MIYESFVTVDMIHLTKIQSRYQAHFLKIFPWNAVGFSQAVVSMFPPVGSSFSDACRVCFHWL